jgi:hypothetical protein
MDCLGISYGICYLQWWQRVCDGRLSGVTLACGGGAAVWLVKGICGN